ncbi:MAG: hypothetical protein KDD92_07825 [Caldilineaceae bacterium]|nr:hypothetical protein [Caldilineaceae bacterium]
MTRLLAQSVQNTRVLLAAGALLLLALLAAPADGQESGRVGLVIRYDDGSAVTRCVEIDNGATGLDVLVNSGLETSIEAQAIGSAVCGIDDEGCSYPQQNCFCGCESSPCKYWSYWLWEDGEWRYSQLGASNRQAIPGSVEGWSWSVGTLNLNAENAPPVYTYAEICEPEQVATETAAAHATASAQPTASSTPSATTAAAVTTAPTVTPTPQGPPIITYLAPDRESIRAGEQVTLIWETQGATTVLLITNGNEQAVAASGSSTLAPNQTTTYQLVARNAAGEDRVNVTVNVEPGPVPTTPVPVETMVSPTMPPELDDPGASGVVNTPTIIVVNTPLPAATNTSPAVIIVNTPTPLPTSAEPPAPAPTATPADDAASATEALPSPTAPEADTPVVLLPTASTDEPVVLPPGDGAMDGNDMNGDNTVIPNGGVPTAEIGAAPVGQVRRIYPGLLIILSVPLLLGAAAFLYLQSRKDGDT